MNSSKLSFRDNLGELFGKPIFIISVIALVFILTLYTGGGGYILGMGIVLITFWAKRWDWNYFGISKFNWTKSIIYGMLYAIGIFVVVDILIQPILEHLFGEIDLQNFDGIRGNFINYIMVFFMWLIAGFGEEILYRGYVVKRLAIICGGTNKSWLFALVITAIFFGLAHIYQGVSGVITTGIIGLIFGLMFFKHRENLLIAMFTHGFYDTIGITLFYLGKERIVTKFVNNFIL